VGVLAGLADVRVRMRRDLLGQILVEMMKLESGRYRLLVVSFWASSVGSGSAYLGGVSS
jgi:hypothetical protein